MSHPVRIVTYNHRWPLLYEEEKRSILRIIGHKVMAIEHIGSTAVPGLGGKPIIDIMVAVNHLEDTEECITPLESGGYKYVPENEASFPERRFFNKGTQPKEQHYHIHMVELNSEFWKRHLLFRDYLRNHPEAAQKYYHLKTRLATKYGSDREGYTNAKTAFIGAAVNKAKKARAVGDDCH